MLWIKAFHIIFMVCWFACLFYLPRLFVNCAATTNEETKQQLILMQRKLFKFSIPFPILTIIFGTWLINLNPAYYFSSGWFHTKLFLVLLLIVYHLICGHIVRQFSTENNRHSHVYFRWFNEIPVFLLFGIIILVVVKPF